MHAKAHENDNAPLVSATFLKRLTIGIALLASLTVAISLGGRLLGERIALAGHTESRAAFDIVIGEDHLRLPANVIRFEDQRRSGPAERVDLYLTWPEMEGYSSANRRRFNETGQTEGLVFLQLSQSTMSRDMSGRIAPIYSHLFEGAAAAGPAGLTVRRLKRTSGYAGETLLLGTLPDGTPYATRCLIPGQGQPATSGDCQRDIHIGDDLSLLYRFSSRLLPQWQAMEQAIRDFARSALAGNSGRLPGKSQR